MSHPRVCPCPNCQGGTISAGVAAATAIAAGAVGAYLGDVLAAAVAVLGMAAAAGLAYLALVLRRDGMWVRLQHRGVAQASAQRAVEARVPLAIEAPKPRLDAEERGPGLRAANSVHADPRP